MFQVIRVVWGWAVVKEGDSHVYGMRRDRTDAQGVADAFNATAAANN